MGYVAPRYQILFVNGINHSLAEARSIVSEIARRSAAFGVTDDRVRLFYNPRKRATLTTSILTGVSVDPMKYAYRCTTELRDAIHSHLVDDVEILVLAHSKGADIVLSALGQVRDSGPTFRAKLENLVTVRTYGGIVYIPNCLGK